MKKTVVLILLILPIFLIITISFAGRIFATYNHIYVERVEFVDEFENDLGKNYVFKIGKGETKETKIKVYPELASNKDVIYTTQDSSICGVNFSGEITGYNFGTTTIIVKTIDGDKTASLLVLVSDDYVSGVTLSNEALTLAIGEIHTLRATISPATALNKNVMWQSDNSEIVYVDANGRLVALKEGEATITVTTFDGGFTSSCVVTVCPELTLPLEFSLKPNKGELYSSLQQSIILSDYVEYNSELIAKEQIKFAIKSGNNNATINKTTGEIQFISQNRIVIVVAYVGDENNPTYQAEIKLIWQNN